MLNFSRKKGLLVVIFILFVVALLLWNIFLYTTQNHKLRLTFLDIGQGDSVLIQTPHGLTALIDGGPGSQVLQKLSEEMQFYKRDIDLIIATHPDADHVGGLVYVLNKYRVNYIVRPGVTANHKTEAVNSLLLELAKARNKGAREILARRGQVFILGSDDNGTPIELHILFPDRDLSGSDSNDASVVAKLVYGKTSALFTGDSPIKIEKYLCELDGHKLKSNILKLGHHGSRTSSSKLFLGFVSPDYAIISVGLHNKYGHPHKRVLDLLRYFDIPIKNTAADGSIHFASDGNQWFEL